MSVVLGGVAVILGLAGVVELSPWLASVIVLGVCLEVAGIVSRRRKARARRYGSEVAALRHIHNVRLLGNEYTKNHAA